MEKIRKLKWGIRDPSCFSKRGRRSAHDNNSLVSKEEILPIKKGGRGTKKKGREDFIGEERWERERKKGGTGLRFSSATKNCGLK